ncbi:hypothetical protein Mapa_001399 [Marchantia paleacea]|nr:hypothetical protein Mapa_001399 [Marchantia paleacea]
MCPPSSDLGLPPTLINFSIMQVEVEAQGDHVCEKKLSSQSSCCGSGGSRQMSDVLVNAGDQDLGRASASKRLQRALVVCFFFMLLEIVGGSLAGSLAILSDAAHLLSDVAGFAISLLALRASQWSDTPQHSYGFLRLEVLGALVSVQSIWIMTGFIVYEAFQRLFLGSLLVDGRLMCLVATFGVAVNLVMIFVLGHGHEHSGSDGGACDGHSHFSFHHHEHKKVDVEDGQCLSQEQKHVYHEEEQMHISCAGGCHHHHEGDKPTMMRALNYSHKEEKPLGPEAEEEFVSLMSSSISPSDEDEHCQKEVHVCYSTKAHLCNNDSHNINLRSAYLHALGDLIQSIGVLITGIVIWIKPEWQLIDLLCSCLFSIVVMSTTFRMVKDVLSILMESTPRDVDLDALRSGLKSIPGVDDVKQLHVWALTTGTNVLTCHLHIKPTGGGAQAKDILSNATQYCAVNQKFKHVTIQIEDISC